MQGFECQSILRDLMKYGVVMRTDVDPHLISDLAGKAETAGWDGFFIWDGFLGPNPWVLLSSVAARTERIRFGVMLTAATVRRPWQLASETATLDRLSKGRLILSLGSGWGSWFRSGGRTDGSQSSGRAAG